MKPSNKEVQKKWTRDTIGSQIESAKKQLGVYWRPGRENLGNYHTKHYSAQHHKYMHGLILHQTNIL
jgi:hypothetical protein